MLLLEGVDLTQEYAQRTVLGGVRVKVHQGDRIGVVGVNGSGKSTLFEILSGHLKPDSGYVRAMCEVAYIRQLTEEQAQASAAMLGRYGVLAQSQQDVVSGGEMTRIKIANALESNPFVLFADEPTANLDARGVSFLTRELMELETLVIISHDRALLDALCTRIWEVSDGQVRVFEGNYSAYREQKQQETARAWVEYEQYSQVKEHLQEAAKQRRSNASKVMKKPKGQSDSRRGDGALARSKGSQQKNMQSGAKALETRMAQLDVKEKPRTPPPIRLDFARTQPPISRVVISGRDINLGYDMPLLTNASFAIQNGSHVALVGDNGCGKTTLMHHIAKNGEGITLAPRVQFGMLHQDFGNLMEEKTVLDNVLYGSVQDQGVARNLLARLLLRGEDVFKPVGVLSGGERVKVALCKLMISDANVLLLDEPTNYLDVEAMEAMQEVLANYEGTLVLVSHDAMFVRAVCGQRLVMEKQTLRLETFSR